VAVVLLLAITVLFAARQVFVVGAYVRGVVCARVEGASGCGWIRGLWRGYWRDPVIITLGFTWVPGVAFVGVFGVLVL